MPSVFFSHTKVQEKEYLNQLLEEKKWFELENFSVFLPKNKDEIEDTIKKKSFEKRIIWLEKEWGEIEKDYFQIVKKFKHIKLLLKYKCHVSYFGPEGKYCRPNLLFVRLRTKNDKKRALETIGHELLHLLFSDFFGSKKLNYPEREGMIDALILQSDLSNTFPQYEKQSVGIVRQKLLKSILYG